MHNEPMDKSQRLSPEGSPPPSPPETESSPSTVQSDDSAFAEDSESISSTSDLAASSSKPVSYPLPPDSTVPDIQEQDKKTPDYHVPRDSRLIRLTGVHPFNVEAPLTDLFNQGFLTSPELFYVRNHGPVPEVLDSEVLDWEFSVDGMVENPLKLTVRDLMNDYENVTLPITLVCAGNRRKEQNMVRKSKGFSWGPAGLSTALFTGVMMAEIIRRARPKRGGRYLEMEGAEDLPNGKYATTLKLNWVMDPNRAIMLAHGMNCEPLRPDHGKPLRAVVPGMIGGRSVKWLKKLIVTDKPSDNWYHIYDNRVLPTYLSPEDAANAPEIWKNEAYAIYDLNNNSAIANPAHDERLTLSEAPETYRIRGYAYAGGGKRITRAEISLDKAKTWTLAEIEYPEDTYREADEDVTIYGGRLDMVWRETCFCWCFWHLDVPVAELSESNDILIRTMDEGLSIQPRDMYWSVLGMMNNPWFRVAIHKEDGTLRFEHPTQPALIPGGWMERIKKAGGNLTNGHWGEKIGDEDEDASPEEEEKEIKMTNDKVSKEISIDLLRKHDTETEPWFVVNGEVFDGTPFLKDHPGGAQSIISAAGTDATDEFMAIHSESARAMMPDYHIGTLDEKSKEALTESEVGDESGGEPREIFLEPKNWRKAVLHEKTSVSRDTRIFKFKMDHEEQRLGLPTGQHLMMRLRDPATREAIIRSYTPISQESKPGFIDVLVKVYYDTKERKGGKMTQALDSIPVGHFVDFKGPIGKFEYLGRGKCEVKGTIRTVKKFVMICGGSGVTPIFQVLRAIMMDKEDETKCVVLDGNRMVEDILCREDLDRFARDNEHKCKLYHTLTMAPEDWTGLRGRIAAPLLKEHCPVAEDCMALICGPESMEKSAHKTLKDEGWVDDDLLFF